MGYYTSYELNVIDDKVNLEDHKVGIGEVSDYGNPFDEPNKWYDHEDDMRAYSKAFPDLVFELTGDGEEAGDNWREYYKAGKVQRCAGIIIYPVFDESQLK
jgi:hypothetical protein